MFELFLTDWSQIFFYDLDSFRPSSNSTGTIHICVIFYKLQCSLNESSLCLFGIFFMFLTDILPFLFLLLYYDRWNIFQDVCCILCTGTSLFQGMYTTYVCVSCRWLGFLFKFAFPLRQIQYFFADLSRHSKKDCTMAGRTWTSRLKSQITCLLVDVRQSIYSSFLTPTSQFFFKNI